MPHWCVDWVQLVSRLCLTGVQIVPHWCADCVWLVCRLCLTDVQIVSDWCADCVWLVCRLCLTGVQIVPCYCGNEPSGSMQMLGISWLAEKRLASPERLCCMEYVSKLFQNVATSQPAMQLHIPKSRYPRIHAVKKHHNINFTNFSSIKWHILCICRLARCSFPCIYVVLSYILQPWHIIKSSQQCGNSPTVDLY